jgi:hypothetical protein
MRTTGYAKLIGRRQIERNDADSGPPTDVVEEKWDCLVTSLPARLGRDGGEKLEGQGEQRGCFVNLGKAKSISRHHATIQWDYKSGQYRIDCHSESWSSLARVYVGVLLRVLVYVYVCACHSPLCCPGMNERRACACRTTQARTGWW